MGIRFRNSVGVKTAANTVIAQGCNKASLAFRLRINTPPFFSYGVNFAVGQSFFVGFYKVDAPNNHVQITFRWSGSTGVVTLIPTLNLNIVNHYVITFDKDDPSSQALYVNGFKTLFPSPISVPLKTFSGTVSTGFLTDVSTDSYDYEKEGEAAWNEYVVTQDEVYDLLDGVDPTTIGGSATWRGYWPMTGEKDAVVHAGDVGLANAIDGSWPFTPFVGANPGSSLVYGDPLPFISQADYGTPIVASSGECIHINSRMASTGAHLPLIAGSVTVMPTIRVAGGPPITLANPFYSGTHAGVVYDIPGFVVPKDAPVTMSAPDAFYSTPVGVADGMTDKPISNKAGRSICEDLPNDVRIGYNYSTGPHYSGPDWGLKNLAYNIAPPSYTGTFREDGTFSSLMETGVLFSNGVNLFDRTGFPKVQGKFALSYDDNDPANPTDIDLYNPNGQLGVLVELTAYRNDGDAFGVGKSRVFDVTPHVHAFTLQGEIDSAATTLTLDGVAGITGGVAGAVNQQWVLIDDEYMNITSVNATTKKIIVTRGEYGSTPVSHLDKAAAIVSYYNYYYDVCIRIQNKTTGSPNYKNLAVFGPADWTLPALPSPVVLDRSIANMRGVSRYKLDGMANGSGVVRHMDTTQGGFDITAEPEHQRLDSDLYTCMDLVAYRKFNFNFKWTSSRPVTPEACPYYYLSYETPNGEMFAATLGADITTAPPADTVETITITDAATAPVFYGLRLLMPSGEVVRVLSVDGDQVEVVRGAELTTPATQAAGPILARYRTPITSSVQYEGNNTAYIEVTTDRPHGLWPNIWIPSPSNPDANPLARIDVTLTAAVSSTTATTLSVSCASGDAPYLVQGLQIVFGTECVRVETTSLTAGVGTVTVTRGFNGTTAATHLVDTVGRGQAGHIYASTKDGTKFAFCTAVGWGHPIQITGPDRFMTSCPLPTPVTPWVQVGEQTWDTTPHLNSAGADMTLVTVSGPRTSYPYEHTARTANAAPGSFLHVNIPWGTTDDGVISIAKSIRDTLAPGKHRVMVELANEVWNIGLPWTSNLLEASFLAGFTDRIDFHVYRSASVADLVRRTFQLTGRGDEVLGMLAWQQGGLSYPLGRAVALGLNFDVCSTAPYFSPGNTAMHKAAFNASSDAAWIDKWIFDFWNDTANIASKLTADGLARRAYETAMGRPLLFDHYEGGVDSMTPTPYTSVINGLTRNIDLVYHPNLYFAMMAYPKICSLLAGSGAYQHLISYFNQVQTPFPDGSFTSPDHYALWGDCEWWGQPAGRGDGSDGKNDNRTCLLTPGQAGTKKPWVNQAATNVSPRRQAVLDGNLAFATDAARKPPMSLSKSFSADAGLTLEALIRDVTGGLVTTLTVGFVEQEGTGFYQLTGDVPAGQSGCVVIRDVSTLDIVAMFQLNPASLENRNLKVSGGVPLDMDGTVPIADISTRTTQTTGDGLSAIRAYGCGKMTASSHQVSYGPDGSVVRDFVLDHTDNPGSRI